MDDSTTGDHHEFYRLTSCRVPNLASQQPTGATFGCVGCTPGRWRLQRTDNKEPFLGSCALRQMDDAVRATGVIVG